MHLPANRRLDILALGEPLTEFTAEDMGLLGDVRHFRRGFGGDSSNLAIAATRQGAQCGYLTRIGDDAFGHSFLELWRLEGIDTSNVTCIEGATTGVYFVARTSQGERQFTYYRRGSAASTMSPQDIKRETVESTSILHASGIGQAISASAEACIAKAISLAREAGCVVSYDTNVRPNLAPLDALRATFENTIPKVDILFLSEHDAKLLYPDQTPLAVAKNLSERGPGLVITTQGSAGCTVQASGCKPVQVPSWSVRAIDTTGAGDALAGAFLASWARGASFEDAAKDANAVAALSTTMMGASESVPRLADVKRLLHTHQMSAPGNPNQ